MALINLKSQLYKFHRLIIPSASLTAITLAFTFFISLGEYCTSVIAALCSVRTTNVLRVFHECRRTLLSHPPHAKSFLSGLILTMLQPSFVIDSSQLTVMLYEESILKTWRLLDEAPQTPRLVNLSYVKETMCSCSFWCTQGLDAVISHKSTSPVTKRWN